MGGARVDNDVNRFPSSPRSEPCTRKHCHAGNADDHVVSSKLADAFMELWAVFNGHWFAKVRAPKPCPPPSSRAVGARVRKNFSFGGVP
eukprot:8859999-Pyramimonas_sp.AAC.1